jgi:hypothetical protein
MKIKPFLRACLLLAASIGLIGQQTPPASPPTVHVKGHGCVKPGNVEGCVVVNDFKAHRKYNVFFLGDKPAMDTGISFEGLGYSHLDPHCKQGQKV